MFPIHPLATRWFLARLIFYPEDGGNTFLRNVGSHTDYMALYPRAGRSQVRDPIICLILPVALGPGVH
jgi:hypothetical protein